MWGFFILILTILKKSLTQYNLWYIIIKIIINFKLVIIMDIVNKKLDLPLMTQIEYISRPTRTNFPFKLISRQIFLLLASYVSKLIWSFPSWEISPATDIASSKISIGKLFEIID